MHFNPSGTSPGNMPECLGKLLRESGKYSTVGKGGIRQQRCFYKCDSVNPKLVGPWDTKVLRSLHRCLARFFFKLNFILFFIQQVLISHQFYTYQCIHVNSNCPIHHTTIPITPHSFLPSVSIRLFSTSCLNFCPANRFICTIFLGFTYMH